MHGPRHALTPFGVPYPGEGERDLLALLRGTRSVGPGTPTGEVGRLLDAAERHGVTGVVLDRLRASSTPVPSEALARDIARELDHEAHLATLREMDGAFASAGLGAVVLKGALLASRLYPRPAARATTDIDLLVAESDLPRAERALATLGFEGEDTPEERRFRREHFHLHLARPGSPPLELHFHAYRGFGRLLRSEPLLARSVPVPGYAALAALGIADEIVYLAVHAAAHRFARIGWLWDLELLVGRASADDLAAARDRARTEGFARVLDFTAALLVEELGCDAAAALATRGHALAAARRGLVSALAPEPARPLARSLTRLVYTTLLCDDAEAAVRYVRDASAQRMRYTLGSSA